MTHVEAGTRSKPSNWVVQVSKSTGKSYWFNTKTGVSTYAEPDELKPEKVDGFTAAQLAALASEDFTLVRDTIEAVCKELTSLPDKPPDGMSPDSWNLARQRRFPPQGSAHRSATHEIAEEFGLGSYSVTEDAGDKFVIVFCLAAPPPELLAERAAEEALAAEAEARRRAEADIIAAAAAAAATRGGPGAGVKRKRPAGNEKSAAALVPVAKVPLLPDEELPSTKTEKRDRRTIEQIQSELDERRRVGSVVVSAVSGSVV